ncbi:MAG: hydrolase [Adhaeribacter sp.]|nr:hydrolase [Adhaeribacter sp.]
MDTNELNNLAAHYTNKLRVRVCGILLEGKKILLVRHQGIAGQYNFWSPPGGGLVFGEKIKACLVREFREETGLEVRPVRFLFMHEYLQEPLHALELFFEVEPIGGGLKKGNDPELGADAQLIQEITFKSLAELRQEKEVRIHQIFEDLIDLDDLFMPQHHFLN